MRKLVALSLVLAAAGCELQPAPPKQASPSPAAPPTQPPPQPTQPPPPSPPQPAQPAQPGAGSGSGSAVMPVTDDCVQVGAHVANLIVASASDAAQRGIYEQERTKMIRSTAETCTKQAWSADAIKCYRATTSMEAIKACETKFPPPAQPQPTRPRPTTPPDGAPLPVQPAQPARAGSAAPRPAPAAGSAAPRAGSAAPR